MFIVFFHVAKGTSLMTEFEEFQKGSNYITATWKAPAYLANHFKLSISCNYICDHDSLYLMNAYTVPSYTTSFNFTELAPGSHCYITLIAVYNPASLDSGIRLDAYTLFESKWLQTVILFMKMN